VERVLGEIDVELRPGFIAFESDVFAVLRNRRIVTIPPSCSVREAVALMQRHGYSQLPVVENGEVLGVFSYRSLAQEAAKAELEHWTQQKCAPGDLPVEEFLEQFEFARVTEEMRRVFDALDRDNGVLLGTPERLLAILTPMDLLRYLYQLANPFGQRSNSLSEL
jgi:predicted transcriptional regulator